MSDHDDPTVGNHDLDLPFQADPAGGMTLDQSVLLAGGVTIAAAVVPIPGLGNVPALRYTFVAPEGSFYPPVLLVTDTDQLEKLVTLTQQATAAAIDGARKAGQ